MRILIFLMIIAAILPISGFSQCVILDKGESSIGIVYSKIPELDSEMKNIGFSFYGVADFTITRIRAKSIDPHQNHYAGSAFSLAIFVGREEHNIESPIKTSINISYLNGENENNFIGLGMSLYYVLKMPGRLIVAPSVGFGFLVDPKYSTKENRSLVVNDSYTTSLGIGAAIKSDFGLNFFLSTDYTFSSEIDAGAFEFGISYSLPN